MTAIRTENVIGLWLDGESGNPPAWIVSRDRMDDRYQAETSVTVAIFPQDEYSRAEGDAIDRARRAGIRVIRTDRMGNHECLYDPADESCDDGE